MATSRYSSRVSGELLSCQYVLNSCCCIVYYCLCLLGQSDKDELWSHHFALEIPFVTLGLTSPSMKNFWWFPLIAALGFGVLGKCPVPAA